jgi:hypothetical protein
MVDQWMEGIENFVFILSLVPYFEKKEKKKGMAPGLTPDHDNNQQRHNAPSKHKDRCLQ